MSTDPTTTPSDGSREPADDALLTDLRSFGLTLEADLDTSIRPTATPAAVEAEPRPVAVLSEDRPSDRRRPARTVVWAVAAALLVAAGFGLGAVWRDRSGSIDSVGPADGNTEGGAEEGGLDEDPAEDTPDESAGPDGDDGATPQSVPAGPTEIVDADGEVIVTVDDADSNDPTVDLVVDELLREEALGDMGRDELADLLAAGGLQIETTLDPEVDRQAIASIEELYPNDQGLPSEPGLVVLDNETGAITALSSRDPSWNGLFNEPRMTGTAIKTVVLAQAYLDGFSPNDVVRADGPCSFPVGDDDAEPLTVGGSYGGAQSIEAVTRSSNNCAFVRLGLIVGPERVLELAKALGLTMSLEEDQLVSLPLGVAELSAIEMAGAYATFANDGIFEEPWLVETVLDADGVVLYEHRSEPRRVIDAQTARLVTETLESNVERGTGGDAQLEGGHPAAGKTGTTSTFTDAWFVGYTGQFTAAVWLGQPSDPVDNPNGLASIEIPDWSRFGGGLPAALWGSAMVRLHEDLEPVPFIEPDRVPAALDEAELLEVPGELGPCGNALSEELAESPPTMLVDNDGDGEADCFMLDPTG